RRLGKQTQHSRTGCVIHPRYVPAKLLWLSTTQPDVFRRAHRWMSIGEYLLLKFCGKAAASTSMISATGLWNQNANDYDAELLGAVGLSREQLAAADELDQPCAGAV